MDTIINLLVLIGLIVMLLMAALPLLEVNAEWMRWAYAGGAVMVLVARMWQQARYNGDNLRVRRLYRVLSVSAMLYCLSAGMTFYHPGTTDWIAFLMAGAVVQTYASWMIDRLSVKGKK